MAKRNRIPQQARTFDQLCDLSRDNVGGADWWFIFNHPKEVVLCNQRAGEASTGMVRLRRRDWDALVR